MVFRADHVLLAAGALASPRLLDAYLRSAGLARTLPAAGAVGRNLKRHHLTAVLAVAPRRVRDRLRKTVLLTSDTFPHSSVQPLGAALTRGDCLAAELPPVVPRRLLDAVGERAHGFFLQTEDGSHPDNRVVAANGSGKPILDFDVDRIPASRDEHRRFVRSFARDLFRCGLVPMVRPVGIAGTAHVCGT
ncbi:hypothetical protein ABTU92_30775, partial [Rhodoplanes sp. SY1]